MVRAPAGAAGLTVMLSVTCVGSVNVMLLTVTPPPFTVTAMWFGKVVSGSKKPAPALDGPVMTTLKFASPWLTVSGAQPDGIAGGGAMSLVTRTPQELVVLQYSWNVHIVMSSSGSIHVRE